MKKRLAMLMAAIMLMVLSGCGSDAVGNSTNSTRRTTQTTTTTTRITTTACSHEWQEATCTSAQKCSKCGLEKGSPRAHTFFQGKCTVCSAKSPDYDKVRKWLQDNDGLFVYFKIRYEIIDLAVERYKLTRDIDIIADIQDDVHEIADDIADIAAGSAKYEELELLYDACDIDMPLLATSSSTYGYALAARTYAQTATRLVIHYNSLCEDFDLPTIE